MSSEEEKNDFEILSDSTKEMRDGRNEAWETKWLPKFKAIFEDDLTHDEAAGRWTLKVGKEIYDFYPKANKVLVRSKNEWKKPGLKFLIKTFIN